MTDPPRSREAGEGTGVDPERASPRSEPPRAPRWVKVSAVIVGVLILLAVILVLTGSGHGPGRHASASGASTAAVDIPATPVNSPGANRASAGSYR